MVRRLVLFLAFNLVAAVGASAQSFSSALGLDAALPGLIKGERALVQSRGVNRDLPDPATVARSVPSVEAAVRQRLLQGEALLVYQQSEDRLSGWLVRNGANTLAFTTAVTPAALGDLVTEWRDALLSGFNQAARAPVMRGASPSREPGVGAKGATPKQLAKALAAILLPQDLPADVRHLTIVPAAATALVPWPALPLQDDMLLVDRVSVSLAPSLNEFLKLRPRSGSVSERSVLARADKGNRRLSLVRYEEPIQYTVSTALIVGDPTYAQDPQWSFPPLAGAREEARTLGRITGQPVLTGDQATRTAVEHAVAGSLDLLYFATHAVADPDNPLDGGFLALAKGTEDKADTGRWTAKQIQSTSITADLVVLSACQTGLGRVHEAGVVGVGRAFYLAGVPNVVVSLWSVDDQATSVLMANFSKQFDGTTAHRFFPADALRAAMLETRKKYPNPALWASFINFGLANTVWTGER